MAHQEEKPGILQMIRNNWFLVLFIGSVVIAWTTLNLQTQANTNRIEAVSARVERNETITAAANIGLSTQLSQMQTDILWIREKLRTIK